MASSERKMIRLTDDEIEYVKTYAAARGMSMSEALRTMVERFLVRGSRLRKKKTKLVAILMPKETSDRAEEKAAQECGATLGEVVRHEIGVIYNRP